MTKARKMMIAHCLVFACVLLLTGGARAQDDYARSGVYVGLAGMYSLNQFADEIGDAYDDSFGINFRGGYRLHPHFAAEFEFMYNFGWNAEELGIEIAELTHWAIFANAKVFFLKENVQPYIILGPGFSKAEEEILFFGSASANDFSLKFGGGLDIYAMPQLVIFIEAAYLLTGFDDLEDLDFIPIMGGIGYRF